MGSYHDSQGNGIGRREFLLASAAVGIGVAGRPRLVRADSANEKLNIGIIGAGGRGATNLRNVAEGNNIVALCDVSQKALDEAAETHTGARQYTDYRKMLDARRDMDAVAISTPDHSHALPTLMAIDLDLHVYCEKPLTHTVWEARKVRAAAGGKPHLATQMGIQIQSGDNYRRVVELIRSGAIGEVREAHVWVARAWGDGDRPAEGEPVPEYLDWDLWIGPAPERPYHSSYMERPGWFKFWDFAGGTATDLGTHFNDLPFWALQLDAPHRIEADGPPVHPETAPAELTIRYEFNQRGHLPPVTLYWTQGSNHPPRYEGPELPEGWNNGAVFIGSEGMILSDYNRHVLLPEEKFADFEGPDPFIERSPGHHAEWLRACRGGPRTKANFDYGGRLTEMTLLGNVAYRSGQTLEWDHQSMTTNSADAEAFIRKEYRQGFEVTA